MDNFNPKPSLNQLSFLTEMIKGDEVLDKHFDLSDTWEKVKNITYRQYQYFLKLIYNKERFKLNELMESLGFPHKN